VSRPPSFPSGRPDEVAWLAWLRENDPVTPVTLISGHQAWLVTRYEDARLVLADRRFAVGPPGRPDAARLGADLSSPQLVMLRETDPPQHTRLRRLVARAYSERRAAYIQGLARHVAGDLLDAMAARGPGADLVHDFADALPVAFACTWLGLPSDAICLIRLWVRTLIRAHPHDDVKPVLNEACSYLTALLAAGPARSRHDLLGRLVTAHHEPGALGQEELVGLVFTMALGGHRPLSSVLVVLLDILLRRPEQLAHLREEPGLCASLIEEVLRWQMVIRDGHLRTATEDVVLAGARVRAGDYLVVSLTSAHRDPEVFSDPDRLDPARDPNPHLAFGVGIHRCLAIHLCRAVLLGALAALLERFSALRLAAPAPEPPGPVLPAAHRAVALLVAW
jgi:nocardicin N-oxygenase